MNLLLIGAPGTGKGTMSEMLVKDHGLVHIATGDILRQSIKEGSEVGQKAQSYIEKGLLVPDEVIHDIIVDRLMKDDVKTGFLMDGYPRNTEQAQDFDTILEQVGMRIDLVILLDLDEEILKGRITGRRLCKDCGQIYHVVTKPSKVEGVCDSCGGPLYTRKDDTLESLKTRLEEYHNATMPIIEYYSKQGLLKTVDASQPKENVYASIIKLLGEVND